ncbi:RNA polymerase sigma factor [Bacillus rubiinfantis]|uniref:RNA polymerase sigma factor n=1 Tax=Bacillus rubiinfantis TaxID=1499680 RepID=UPI0005A6151F|nr:RNA polymerase sigma factor [Bacillus rubiinfantis]
MNYSSLQRLENTNNYADEFKQFFQDYKKHVFAIALSILRDTELAEDVLQEVYIKLYQEMKHKKIPNVKAWLITVSRNTALDLYRKKKREITGFDGAFFERSEWVSDDPVDKMVLSKYLELLNQEERQIIILKDVIGMKHREIAKIVEMPLGTVLWKYNAAMKKLQKSML